MKKLLAMVLCALVVLSLISCVPQNSEAPPANEPDTTPEDGTAAGDAGKNEDKDEDKPNKPSSGSSNTEPSD